MVKSIRQITLTTAIGLALVGAGLQSSTIVEAAVPQAVTSNGTSQTSGDGVYIITFEEAGLLHYDGSVNGIQTTAPSASTNNKLDVNSSAAMAYKTYLTSQRTAHRNAIESALGRSLNPTHSYAITQNGIAAHLSPAEASQVAKLPGVKSVREAGVQHIDTYRGPTFIGADTIWSGANTPGQIGTRGQGVTVGVLDSGSYSANPLFANDTTCGFRPSKPKLVAVDCSVTDVNGFCAGPDPEAAQGNGHGVHTASTVGGNTIDNTANPAPLLPDGVNMSGVAPCAAIVSYKVCQTSSCDGADILAGINNAIADGVDVINFSISGGNSPWLDNDRDFLDAINADVFVAASAGNTRAETPDPVGAVNHLGPWMMSVAASTQDQLIGPQLAVTGPDPLPPMPDLTHVPLNPGSTTVVGGTTNFTGDHLYTYPTNIIGCTSTGGFPANYFSGAIAMVRRGTCSFTEKITNAFNAGATFVVIGNNAPGGISMNTAGAPVVPAFSVTQEFGDALIAYAAGNNPPAPPADQIFKNGFDQPAVFGATADYARAVQSSRQGDVLAGFSLRGPTPFPYADESKPDITGPGVDIYAGLTAAEGSYGFLSGTSMSSPHLAGSAALMRAVHPGWSVTEVKSAMMTTATNAAGVKEDTVTAWDIDDVGAGRIDLTKAALAGLTMNETYANFVAADPDAIPAGDVKTLNLPELRNTGCLPSCSWTRVFKNQLPVSGTWNASFVTDPGFAMIATPSSFTLAPGATQSVVFTATPSIDLSSIAFGNVILTEQSAMSPAQHLTVAVKSPPPTIEVTPATLTSSQATNTSVDKPLTVANIGGGTLNWSVATTANGVVWNQPTTLNSGVGSSYSTADAAGGWIAADFQVATAGPVSKLTVYGFDNTNTLPAQSAITWSIYGDAAGAPDGNPNDGSGNAPVWTYTAAPASAGVTITGSGEIALDLAAAAQSLNLGAGTYWLTVNPTYPDPFPAMGTSTAGPWRWFTSAKVLNDAALVGDEYGLTAWTSYTAAGLPATIQDVAFKIEGTITCGASWLSLAPTSGNVAGGGNTPVTATFNSAGLNPGSYTATACIQSNDAANPLVTVPVTLTVQSSGGSCPSQILLDPGFEATQPDYSNVNWASTSTNGGTSICDSACGGAGMHAGAYWSWFGGWGNGVETGTVTQSVVIASGTDRWINFYLRRTAATGDPVLTVKIDGNTIATYPKVAASEPAFVLRSVQVPASYIDSASHIITMQFDNTTGAMGSMHVDDVTLDCTQGTAAPSQASPLTDALRSIH